MDKNIIPNNLIKPPDALTLLKNNVDSSPYLGTITGVTDSIANEYNTYKTATENVQNQQATTGTDILGLMNEISGKTADTQAAKNQTGVGKITEEQNKYVQQLADLNAQASILNREAQAIPLQVQEQFKNTGATDRGVAPIETGKLRENAIRALSIAQQSDVAAAALTGSEVRLQAAKDKAQQIVDLKYKPLEEKLAIKERQYALNKDILDKYDKKRSEALGVVLEKEKADLAERKATEKSINDMGVTLAQYGVDQSVIQRVLQAKSVKDAIAIAGANLRDPKARYELEKLKLDLEMSRADIAYKKKQTELLGEATPEQKKKEVEALKSVQGQNETLKNKVNLIDAILSEKAGFQDRVGPNALTRKPATLGGRLTRGAVGAGVGLAVGGVPGAVTGAVAGLSGGIRSDVTGAGQRFAGGVHQLASQEFIDALIDAKKQGATFGALTDREGDALRAAATKINDWEIKGKNGLGTGVWNIDEKSFTQELNAMKLLANKAILNSGGTILQSDEQELLDNIYGADTALDPSAYYQ